MPWEGLSGIHNGLGKGKNLCHKQMSENEVVAQLVEQLLLIPKIHSLNPVIGKFKFPVNCVGKTKIRPRIAHLKNVRVM